MLPIRYPKDINNFNLAYLNTVKGRLDDRLNDILKKVIRDNGDPLNWETLLISPFNELLNLHAKIKALSGDDQKLLASLDTYGSNQPYIATFFMAQREVSLSTCYYCNIDTIFAYSEIGDYKDGLDFIQRADIYQLQLINSIGPKKADVIIQSRLKKQFGSIDELPVSDAIKKELRQFNPLITHNHFTIDHFFYKADYPFISLCLYNFIPSCYACNSKLKGMGSLYTDQPGFSSPSSAEYSFHHDVHFKLFYHHPQQTITKLSDFSVEMHISANHDSHSQYLSLLKLRGRYHHYKNEALRLIEKSKEYPDSKIEELSREMGLSNDQLKKIIFGDELFDSAYDQSALVKYKRDIAANIKILD